MKFSIVVPALNEERYLPLLLKSVADTGLEGIQVIVVDGKSDDATQEVVRRFADEQAGRIDVRLVVADKRNVGYQRNLGASHATNEIIVFLDADSAITNRETIEALIAEFETGQVAAATTRLRPIEKSRVGEIYFWFGHQFHRFQERRSPYAMGAFMMTRKSVFDAVGGFDETIRVGEDSEYCLRASKQGPFRVFRHVILTSVRRFDKEGYALAAIKYLRLLYHREFRGELRDDHIEYKFGHYDS